MKRILIVLVLLASGAFIASGQVGGKSTKYFNRTEAGFAFGVGDFEGNLDSLGRETIKNNEIVMSFQTVNGFIFNNRVTLGAGLGVEKWQNGLFFPLFGQLTYFLKPVENTFFVDASVGYGFGSRDATSYHNKGDGALLFSFGLGYIRNVSKRLQFHCEAFYKYQALESSYNVSTRDTTWTEDYKVPLSFIGLRVGIHFK